jgi:hypothetical protein
MTFQIGASETSYSRCSCTGSLVSNVDPNLPQLLQIAIEIARARAIENRRVGVFSGKIDDKTTRVGIISGGFPAGVGTGEFCNFGLFGGEGGIKPSRPVW